MALVEVPVEDIKLVAELATGKDPVDQAIRLSAAQNEGGVVTTPQQLADRVAELKATLGE